MEVLVVVAHALGDPVHNGCRHLAAEIIISLLIQGLPIGQTPAGMGGGEGPMYEVLGGVQQLQIACKAQQHTMIVAVLFVRCNLLW